MDFSEIFILSIVIGMILCGLVGIFIPQLPGVVLIWGGIFLYAIIEGFQKLDTEFILFISILIIFASSLDYVERILYSRKVRQKTCFMAIFGSVIGGVIGSLSGGIFLLLAGSFIGAVVGEIFSGKESIFVLETRKHHIFSFFGATITKISLASVIILLFLERVFLV